MKYFPVNTALYDSPKKLKSIYANPDDVIADSDSEKASVSTHLHGNVQNRVEPVLVSQCTAATPLVQLVSQINYGSVTKVKFVINDPPPSKCSELSQSKDWLIPI